MLKFLDVLFTIIHLAIIGFNLFGWMWPAARRVHLVSIVLTAACWFILGIWFGVGYCPITDWQWQVKEKLGESDLPESFIKYFADKVTGENFAVGFTNYITLASFAIAALLSVYMNFFYKKQVQANIYDIH
jgi:hypothetical protein